MPTHHDLLIVGAGVFGATAALTLAQRGRQVTLLDRGPPPHPAASSTDLSKLVRPDYGHDAFYTDAVLAAQETWRAWNPAALDSGPLYHETGLVVLAASPMAPGSFEGDSFDELTARGLPLQRLTPATRAQWAPEWSAEHYPDGYKNPLAGWAESGAVVAWLLNEARAAGVTILDDAHVVGITENRVPTIKLADGRHLSAEQFLVCAGAWTASLLPELSPRLRVVGQPVFHLRPEDPARWRAPRFPAWAADIAGSGWYGFPATAEGLVKVANHGAGRVLDPYAVPLPGDPEEQALHAFLAARLPGLAEAPIVGRRTCLYCDSVDGDLLIDRHPERPGVFVAAGGSGHAFKLAPALGPWTADVLAGGPPPPRLRWDRPWASSREAARFEG